MKKAVRIGRPQQCGRAMGVHNAGVVAIGW